MRDTTPHVDPLLITGATIDALGVPPLIVEGEDVSNHPSPSLLFSPPH